MSAGHSIPLASTSSIRSTARPSEAAPRLASTTATRLPSIRRTSDGPSPTATSATAWSGIGRSPPGFTTRPFNWSVERRSSSARRTTIGIRRSLRL